jgi:hypothetical protein
MSSLSFDAPQMSISAPKTMEWHMIADYELDQLSHSETGFIGSLGFVGLGAAIGLLPQTIEVFGKLSQKVPTTTYPVTLVPMQMTPTDLACVGAFFGSLVLTLVCLTIAGVFHHRNKGLAKKIRNRAKPGAAPVLHAA